MNNFSWHNYLNQVNQHTFIKMFAFLEHDLVKLGHELDEILRSYVNYYDNNLITSILDKFVISRVIQYLTPTLVLEKEAYEKKYKLSFDEYLKNNFEDLYTKYPVTKVLLESVINETKIFCKELINNLNLDYADLAIFDLDKNYLLKNIQPVGDVHEYGKSVLLLVFVAKVNGVEKNLKLIYKPQNLLSYITWNSIVNYFSQNSGVKLKTFQLLARDTYGYIEYIEHKECTPEKISNYYVRIGALLALGYAFGGNDIHAENIIAYDGYPVLIDIETFFHPLIYHGENQDRDITHSMSTIATSILPNRIYNPKLNHSVDISVFSNLSQQKSLVKLVTVATDNASALEYKFSKLGNIVYNLPNLSHDPLLYHQEVINGFEKAYNFILENKESLLTLCENLAMLKIRHLMQSTVIYAQCLRALQHPTFLASLDNYLKYLEKTLGQNVSPLRQFGMASEINALSKFCIPTFWIDNKLFKIQNGYGDEVDIKIKLNSYETIKFILRERLSKQDIYAQKFAILTSFYCARQSASVPKIKSIPELSLFKNLIKVDPVKSIDKHISLLINLFDDVKLEDDQKALIGWATTKYFIDDTCSVSHANLSVYDGLIGISLSYAAVAVSHKSDARDKSLMAIEQCIKFLYDRCTVRNTMLDINSKGFYGSTGGVIYGLAIIDMLLGELPGISKQQIAHVFDHILQRIYKVLLNLESIKTQELDLINGTIGTLLALMRAYQITKNKTFHQYIPINDVLDFVQQLLPVEEYFADKKNLISLAHGGAGILYAHFLVWQFQATHADTYSKFLQLYLINLKDQLDDSSSVQSWCNGLGGVILVLVTIINNDANSARLIRVEILLKLLVQKFLENIDNHNFNLSLCHGVSGDLEVIYQLWQNGMISENQYKTYKIRFEEIIMQENDNNKHQYVMGLFSGYAGIIYQAFRLKNPELIPNILL